MMRRTRRENQLIKAPPTRCLRKRLGEGGREPSHPSVWRRENFARVVEEVNLSQGRRVREDLLVRAAVCTLGRPAAVCAVSTANCCSSRASFTSASAHYTDAATPSGAGSGAASGSSSGSARTAAAAPVLVMCALSSAACLAASSDTVVSTLANFLANPVSAASTILRHFDSIAFLFRNMLSHSQTIPKGGPPTLRQLQRAASSASCPARGGNSKLRNPSPEASRASRTVCFDRC